MTPKTCTPLPMASAGCACCAPALASEQTAPAAGAASSVEASATYGVEGMTCGHCAASVTEEITALEGVSDVRIDVVAGGVSTVTVSGRAAPQAVWAAVEAAGYTVVMG